MSNLTISQDSQHMISCKLVSHCESVDIIIDVKYTRTIALITLKQLDFLNGKILQQYIFSRKGLK